MSFLFGVALCSVLIAVTASRGGNPAMLLDCRALFFVLGGTLGSMLITFPFAVFREQVAVIARLLRPAPKPGKLVGQITELAQTARREGILALEGKDQGVSDGILRKGLNLITVSADYETIQSVLRKESEFIAGQEKAAQDFFDRLSILAPGIGMVGTLVEIVQMLYHYTGPQKLAPGIAVSLLPFVYGALVSYLILLPLASRLKVGAGRRQALRELSIEGVLAIQSGEPPYIVEQRLEIYLQAGNRKRAGARN